MTAETFEVELDHLERTYGVVRAVDDLSLGIRKGELISLLGPSGCGKTTTLRMVAGFITPTRGRVVIRGREVTHQPPYKRDTGMVFQSYALFPHLSVFENLAFGLRRRRVNRVEIGQRVAAMLDILDIADLGNRYPRQLSGGQQQRVAVGRALVVNPAVILLDEPFSNLDAKLRENTRVELRRLQQELGLTALFVTHDQEEAMAISDRIVVMNHGRVEQIGTAQEIYERPATRFVAAFIGAANVLQAHVLTRTGERLEAKTTGGLELAGSWLAGTAPTGAVTAVIRPEEICVGSPSADSGPNRARARVEVASYLGGAAQLSVRTPLGEALLVRGDRALASLFPAGTEVELSWDPATIYFFAD